MTSTEPTDPTTVMSFDRAVRIVAQVVIAELIRDHAEHKWEDHPEIGESDWDAVACQVDEIGEELGATIEDYNAAYAFLRGRVTPDVT